MQEVNVERLPALNEVYPISKQQSEDYLRDGHIVLRSVASKEEIDAYRPLLGDAVKRFNTEIRPLHERDTYGKAFLQIMNLWERDQAIRRFVMARRFAQIAADLMGVDGVRLYHDQALFKEPGGGHTPWHQDQMYWPVDTNKMITMWMPMVDVPAEVGTMRFVSGSQKFEYASKLAISDQSDEVFEKFIQDSGMSLSTYGAMSAGDATFHSGWTLHSAPGNPTDRTREVMTIIYFADGAKVVEPDSPHRKADLERWFPGLKTGDLANSELNPLLFSRNCS